MEREPLVNKKQLVQIKGTKDGLVLQLDDQCAYFELLTELEQKVEEGGIDGKVDVQLHLATRYCTLEQKKELIQIVQSKGNMTVSKVMSDVLTVEECNKRVEEQTCDTYIGIIRSGQIIHAKGDIIVVGDVNPNGKVTAVGSIYVLGKLKGMAHAGVEGNEEAIIAASTFVPTHVSIANNIEVKSNEQDIIHTYDGQLFAYVNDLKKITYDRIQEVRNIRPSLSIFKGGS